MAKLMRMGRWLFVRLAISVAFLIPGLFEWFARRWDGLPYGTAVDPTLFPEEEYPLDCLDCAYSLRGLPDGNCPECGAVFQRGAQLVDVYVFGRRPRTDNRPRIVRLLVWLILAVLSSMLWGPCIPGFQAVETHWANLVIITGFVAAILFLSADQLQRSYAVPRRKFAAVLSAIKPTTVQPK